MMKRRRLLLKHSRWMMNLNYEGFSMVSSLPMVILVLYVLKFHITDGIDWYLVRILLFFL
jgi:hypothetical protein